MKIERMKVEQKENKKSGYITLLKSIRDGEVLRITTAAEAYSIISYLSYIRKSGIDLGIRKDGDDVIIFKKK